MASPDDREVLLAINEQDEIDGLNPDEDADIEADLEAAKVELRKCVKSLIRADGERFAILTRRIQRLRIVVGLLTEIKTGELNDDVYRQLVLAQRMLKDGDGGEAADKAEAEAEQLDSDVKKLPISEDRLAHMVRAFERMSTQDVPHTIPEDYDADDIAGTK